MQTSSVTQQFHPPIQPTKHIEVAANGSDIHSLSIADTNFQYTFLFPGPGNQSILPQMPYNHPYVASQNDGR